ncbi:right-handed parallel beta-helix repeat-containing protein [Bacteroides ovatus]|uniref:right-handed parallel beta-helix repeat-containing protein n=1 Tax=Bacteroides ovatus TaxID=28116 RepID=UPI0020A74CBF|nr:right-handed parallel beta-helix repeat-containing protein [Bacteroides ovatus]CAG9929755.1 hypothetical protein BOVA208_4009 [Bacteroides ovatus]
MKHLFLFFIGLVVAALSCISCSDDDNEFDSLVAGYQSAIFSSDSITVASTGGTIPVLVEWNNTEWFVEYEVNEKSFIERISNNAGGKTEGDGVYILYIQCVPNMTQLERNQTIYLTSKATGERIPLVLTQLSYQLELQSYRCLYVAPPAEVEVAPDGSEKRPFRSIAAAAQIATAGDTVFVKAGTYVEENITPTSGRADAMIVFKPVSDNAEVIIRHPGQEFTKDGTPVFNLNQRSYIWVEGFTFKSYYYAGFTFEMKEANHCVVFNNHFEDIGNDQIVNNGISLIRLYNASDNVICNNFFKNIYGDGVSMGRESKNNLVADNTFEEFKGKARGWAGEGSSFTTNITLGDEQEYDSNNLIAFNLSHKGKALVWFDRNGSDNIVLRNLGHDAGAFIFNESRCKRNLIQENIGYNISGVAYETARYNTGYTEDQRMVNNIAYKSGTGFFMSKSWRTDMRNNIAYLCKNFSVEFDETAKECGPHNFENNLWGITEKNGENCLKYLGESHLGSYLVEQEGGTNGPTGDPQFKNPDNGDFTFVEGSPAIGSGKLGLDLGPFAVYPPTEYGWNENRKLSKGISVNFAKPVSNCVSLGQHIVNVKLSSISQVNVTVKVEALAGDARPNTDYTMIQEVTFVPGEISKDLFITVNDSEAEDDQLLCLRLTGVNIGKVGPRSLHAIRIMRNK